MPMGKANTFLLWETSKTVEVLVLKKHSLLGIGLAIWFCTKSPVNEIAAITLYI